MKDTTKSYSRVWMEAKRKAEEGRQPAPWSYKQREFKEAFWSSDPSGGKRNQQAPKKKAPLAFVCTARYIFMANLSLFISVY